MRDQSFRKLIKLLILYLFARKVSPIWLFDSYFHFLRQAYFDESLFKPLQLSSHMSSDINSNIFCTLAQGSRATEYTALSVYQDS